jgi:thioredoxin 1
VAASNQSVRSGASAAMVLFICLQSMRRVVCRAPSMEPQIDTSSAEPTRAAIDALAGPTLLEFGTSWCGHCRAAQPLIASALKGRSGVRHVKVEDGSGQPLGRSYGVKLWPTLVFLADGREAARLIRPRDAASISKALELIAPMA